MPRNIDYAHFDVDVIEHEKIIALVDDGGADAFLAWQALVLYARRAVDPAHLERAGTVTVPIARRVVGALGYDARKMVELLERHHLLDVTATPGSWRLHDFAEHQHLAQWVARQRRSQAANAARWGGVPPSGVLKDVLTESPNPTQPIESQKQPSAGVRKDILKDVRKELSPRKRPAAAAADDEIFNQFYTAYPRKKEPHAARSAWDKALAGGADPGVVIAAAAAYAAQRAGQDPTLTKYPATWLNRGCWLDVPDDDYHHAPVREVGTFE